MPYRLTPLQNDYFYHLFNRGVEKREIFSNERDYERFIQTIYYYQFSGPKPKFSNTKRFKLKDFYKNPKIVEIICFCLMPNHFHFLLKQLRENGIQEFISKVSNSFTKYYNTKHNRIGPLLQGPFKVVLVESDDQLLHLSRYIHLNPLVSDLVSDLESFEYSSYLDFIGARTSSICSPKFILDFFKKPNSYKEFTQDHEGYAKELYKIKHLLLEDI